MRITADKIASRLGKNLAPVWVVAGDEPLLVGEAVDLIRAAARDQGYEERESYSADARFDWEKLRASFDNLSLFATRKIVEIRLPTGKPGRQGGAAITDLVADLPADILFIFILPRIDKRTGASKWAQALQQGVWADVRDVAPEQLPAWISQRMQQAGLQAEPAAVELMAMRIEGNLMAAQQEISKLALLAEGERITPEMVQRSVADGARFDVFQLADAAVGQNVARAVRILYGLRKEGVAPALTLWALVREVNALVGVWAKVDQGAAPGRAMNEARIWRSRQPLYAQALRRHDEASMRNMLASASLADKIVKGARPGAPWGVLLELVLLVAGARGKQAAYGAS